MTEVFDFCFVFSLYDTFSVSCQPGWIKFNESCYFFATSSKNWESSRQYCKSKGGDLVVVNSQEEQVWRRERETGGGGGGYIIFQSKYVFIVLYF